MRRTTLIGVAVGIFLVIGLAAGTVSEAQQSSPTVTPDRLGGYEERENITGAQAEQAISKLHRNPDGIEGFDRAVVAKYGESGSGELILYVSVYNETADADRDIQAMTAKIRQMSGFGLQSETVGDTDVYTATRGGSVFAFFSHQKAAYWITYPQTLDASTATLVEEVQDGYSESGGFPLAIGLSGR